MGARPSSFKRGGGFLNNVDATITGITFLVGETAEVKKGPRKGEDFTPLSMEVSFRQDNADEDVSKRLLIGDAAQFGEVSDDGSTLYTPEGQTIYGSSEAGIFVNSLVNPEVGEGFPEDRLSDSTEEIEYKAVIGTRVHLVQVARTGKRAGTQVSKKDNKTYELRDLTVGEVLELPLAGKRQQAAKGKTAAKAEPDNDVAEIAGERLVAYVTAAPKQTLQKAKLRVKISTDKELADDAALRTEVIKYLTGAGSDDNIAGVDGVDYSAKSGEITLA